MNENGNFQNQRPNQFNGSENGRKPKKGIGFYWIYIVLVAFFLSSLLFNGQPSAEEIVRSKMITLLRDKHVEKIELVNGEEAEIYLNEEGLKRYFPDSKDVTMRTVAYTYKPMSLDQFVEDIEKAQIDNPDAVDPKPVTRHNWGGEVLSWVLPIVIIMAFWFVIMRLMGRGGMGGGQIFNIGKSKRNTVPLIRKMLRRPQPISMRIFSTKFSGERSPTG